MIHERVEFFDCDLLNQLWIVHHYTSISTHVVAGDVLSHTTCMFPHNISYTAVTVLAIDLLMLALALSMDILHNKLHKNG